MFGIFFVVYNLFSLLIFTIMRLFSFISLTILIHYSFSQTSTITMWKDSAMGTLWNKATKTVVFNKPNKKSIYKIYLCDSLGNNETQLTYAGWPQDRQQWAEEWHPSGQYLFCYVEKEEYVKEKNHKRKPVDAIPGYGAYTDLWLLSRDGKRAWQLTDLPNAYSSGIIHCAISPDGTKFAWSERIAAPKFLNKNLGAGSYVFRVADIVLDSVPHFENIKTYMPGDVMALNELESISADNKMLYFYSTFETKNIITTPVYSLNLETNEIKRLTTESFAQAPALTPDGKHIVYMTGQDCDIFPMQLQGADWWIMDTNGENKKRLTFMNKQFHPQCVNKYRLAGSLSFINNNSFFGGVMTKSLGLVGYTVKVVLSED